MSTIRGLFDPPTAPLPKTILVSKDKYTFRDSDDFESYLVSNQLTGLTYTGVSPSSSSSTSPKGAARSFVSKFDHLENNGQYQPAQYPTKGVGSEASVLFHHSMKEISSTMLMISHDWHFLSLITLLIGVLFAFIIVGFIMVAFTSVVPHNSVALSLFSYLALSLGFMSFFAIFFVLYKAFFHLKPKKSF